MSDALFKKKNAAHGEKNDSHCCPEGICSIVGSFATRIRQRSVALTQRDAVSLRAGDARIERQHGCDEAL